MPTRGDTLHATDDVLRASGPGRPPARLPLVVHVLALGTFLMGTTEFVVAGLLLEIAGDGQVSVAQAGLLITVFAVGMIVGAPLMAMLTLRLPPRLTLILALGIFAAGHVIVAVGSDFTMLLAARFLTALATGAFWSVANVVAAISVRMALIFVTGASSGLGCATATALAEEGHDVVVHARTPARVTAPTGGGRWAGAADRGSGRHGRGPRPRPADRRVRPLRRGHAQRQKTAVQAVRSGLGAHPDGRPRRDRRSRRRPPDPGLAGHPRRRHAAHRRLLVPPAHPGPAPHRARPEFQDRLLHVLEERTGVRLD
ncbi:MFS transporter [Streptomyces sp. NRRL S-813]|uniref:MFS transporter n=1 Tax=Streptomyces sp. NRRL S-813 TaxID=1463919 RepID=UPI0004C0393A|nr:MFS transporter [Streptomyces sp. NRRL S-813]